MEYSSTKRKEQERRKKSLFKTIFVIICLLIISLIIMNKKINNIGIENIGRHLSDYYSRINFEYLIETEDSENDEYFLIKRLDDKVYYENNRKVKNEYIKDIYYFELKKGKAWKVLEDEKIILTDDITINHYPDKTKSRGSYLQLLELSVSEEPFNDRMQM